MRHIMVATDGSDGATRAIDVAVELAKALSGTLSIVTVATAMGAEQEQFARVEGEMIDPSESLAQRILNEAAQRAQLAGITERKTMLVWGDPAEAIIETIKRERADAIVVGRRGRGRLSGLLLGSVSQKLCSLAPCVVIVAP